MKKKKKSNIIYKSAGFIVLIAVIIVIIIVVGNLKVEKNHNEFIQKAEVAPNSLGYETFEYLKKGEAKIACNDAKQLSRLFVNINTELAKNSTLSNDNMSEEQLQQLTSSSQSTQMVDKFSNDLVNVVVENYRDNQDFAKVLLMQITQEIYTNIAQISLMVATGNISEKEFYDYIDITYCGATPPATYISPHDIVIYSNDNSTGRGLLEELNDNITNSDTANDNVSK